MLLTTLLLELGRTGVSFWNSRIKKILFVMSALMILFFRNNGIYALAAFLALFAVIYRKSWQKWLKAVLVSIFIFVIATTGLKHIFHFQEGEIAEMLCVPMQQLARTYVQEKESFSEDELETIYSLIPKVILDKYNPKLADNIKVNFLEDNFKDNPKKYVFLWFQLGLKYPDIYANSFLANTYGYWYPDTVLDGYKGKKVYMDAVYGDSSYFAFLTEQPGERIHMFPLLERFYEKISWEIYQQKFPVVSMLFSIGFWNWCYAFLAFYLLITRHVKQALSLALIGMIYLTVLLGPIALVRYVLYFFFAAPLVFALLFDTETMAGIQQG